MVVSFGTSYNESRELTIGAIENAIGEAYPDYEVRRAFTSQMIINKLKKRDGIEIDNVKEAAAKAVADGVQTYSDNLPDPLSTSGEPHASERTSRLEGGG